MVFISNFFKKLVKNKDDSNKNKKKINPNVQRDTDPFVMWRTIGELGDGAFGKVFKTEHKEDKRVAALKQVEFESDDEIEDLMVEIDILTLCKHVNIVELFEAYLHEGKIWMFIEFCGGGAIDSLMMELEKPLTEPQIRYVTREMCTGLSFLHSHHIIHRDLKAGNVLVTYEGLVKLADFGVSAKNRDEKQKRDTYIGTPYWMAPEVIACELFKDQPYDQKADIWSLAITLIEFAQMKPPNSEMHPMRVGIKIQKAEPPKLMKPANWSPEFHAFLKKCLWKLPDARLSASQLLEEPFIKDVKHEDNLPIRQLISEAKAEVIETLEEMDQNSRNSTTSYESSEAGSITTDDDLDRKTPNISVLDLSHITDDDINAVLEEHISSVIEGSRSEDNSLISVALEVKQALLDEIYASVKIVIPTPSADIAAVINEVDQFGSEEDQNIAEGNREYQKEDYDNRLSADAGACAATNRMSEITEESDAIAEGSSDVSGSDLKLESERDAGDIEHLEQAEQDEEIYLKRDDKSSISERNEDEQDVPENDEQPAKDQLMLAHENGYAIDTSDDSVCPNILNDSGAKADINQIDTEKLSDGQKEQGDIEILTQIDTERQEDEVKMDKTTDYRAADLNEFEESKDTDETKESKRNIEISLESGVENEETESAQEDSKIDPLDSSAKLEIEDEESLKNMEISPESSKDEKPILEKLADEEDKFDPTDSAVEIIEGEGKISQNLVDKELDSSSPENIEIAPPTDEQAEDTLIVSENTIDKSTSDDLDVHLGNDSDSSETKKESANSESDTVNVHVIKSENDAKVIRSSHEDVSSLINVDNIHSIQDKENESSINQIENIPSELQESLTNEENPDNVESKPPEMPSTSEQPEENAIAAPDDSDTVIRRRNQLNENATAKKHYKTLKKVRKFTIDGQEYTTTTRRKVTEGADDKKRYREYLQRKLAMREVKRLQIQEQRENRELITRQDAQRDELELRLKQEEMTLRRNQEQELDSLQKHHRSLLDKTEADHNSQLKISTKRLKCDQERELRRFRDTLKTEKRVVKHEVDCLPKAQRKEELRRRMDTKDEEFHDREKKFQEDQQNRLNAELSRLQVKFADAIDALEQDCMQEYHEKRMQHNDARGELQLRHLQLRHAQYREHQQELFRLKRQQNACRQDLERSLLQRALAKEEAELMAAQNDDLKQLPKLKTRDMKIRQEIFRQSLMIQGTCAPEEEKERIRAFEESERERVKSEIEAQERRYKRRLQTLTLSHHLHLQELEEIHAEKQKQLLDQETIRMSELQETCHKQMEAKKADLESIHKFLQTELDMESKNKGTNIRQRSNSIASMRSFRGSIFS